MGKGFDLAKAMGYEVSNLDPVQELPLDKLDPNPDNFFSVESDLTELAESISVNGLLQPLVVTPADGGRYRVVAGHRRRMALLELAKADPAKWRMIPCKIIHPATHDMELLALIQTNTVARELGWRDRSEAATRVEAILVRLQQEQGVTLPDPEGVDFYNEHFKLYKEIRRSRRLPVQSTLQSIWWRSCGARS